MQNTYNPICPTSAEIESLAVSRRHRTSLSGIPFCSQDETNRLGDELFVKTCTACPRIKRYAERTRGDGENLAIRDNVRRPDSDRSYVLIVFTILLYIKQMHDMLKGNARTDYIRIAGISMCE